MKSIFIAFIIAMALPFNSEAQSTYNNEVTDRHNNLLLLGKSTRDRLQQAPFDNWFNSTYNSYLLDSAVANQVKSSLGNKRFVIFMGTWCIDSRREVPRLYKLLDYCGVPPSRIELINVDYRDSVYKQSPSHEERGLQIHRVPDLLVYEKNAELGRIVESPVESWEKDLLKILQGEAYIPKYRGVPYLTTQLQSTPVKEMGNRMQELVNTLRPLVQNRYELQSFGLIQMALKNLEKAILVYRINSLLFPNEQEVWNSLTDACLKYNNASR